MDRMGVERSGIVLCGSNGITLAYESFGSEADPPVVLIMGLSSQMVIWDDDFCTGLASRGFRVVRFDNRDVGLSSRFTHAGVPDIRTLISNPWGAKVSLPYTLADMAEDTVGLMDALDMGSAHVVGASMGGMIAQELAIRYPGRVRSLTSIMSTTGDPSLPPPSPEALDMLFWPIPVDRNGYVEYFKRVWRLLSGPVYPMDELDIERLAALTYERGVEPASSARQFAAILAAPSRRKALASLDIPALVIHGDRDPLVHVECGRDTARAIPNARLVVVEGMGHAISRPVWGLIIEELAGHFSRS